VLWYGILRSTGKRLHRKGKGWGVEFRRVYCVAESAGEARARLACRIPGPGWQLRAIQQTTPSQIPDRLEDVLQPDELEQVERGMALSGRTLASTARP